MTSYLTDIILIEDTCLHRSISTYYCTFKYVSSKLNLSIRKVTANFAIYRLKIYPKLCLSTQNMDIKYSKKIIDHPYLLQRLKYELYLLNT